MSAISLNSIIPSWTPEQEAIFAAAREKESVLIDALAGTGKTTTLVEFARRLPANVPCLALAFNVRIKKELEARLPKNFTVSTMNGLGHSAWGRALGKRMGVEEKKLANLVSAAMKEFGWFNMGQDKWIALLNLVRAARSTGIVPNEYRGACIRLTPDDDDIWKDIADDQEFSPNEDELRFCRYVLLSSIKQSFAGTIDFDDQIYMSALFGGVFTRFPMVLVDEAQDLSPLNHKQVERSASDRIAVFGDPRQAIYAFRGADADSMGKLRRLRKDWIDLPLNTTFRCPRLVVARQHSHVPQYRAAPSNAEGAVHRFDGAWTWEDIERLGSHSTCAVISRNNAPVISAAFRLIRHRRAVTVLGRDIGKNLITLSKKIIPDDSMKQELCFAAINSWQSKEISLARANEKEHKVAGIEDRAESLLAVFESGGAETAGHLRRLLQELFESSSSKIVLSTGHKAKGLEWDLVVHLDPWRVPSKYARAAAERGSMTQMNQDLNLRYVIETRTKNTLVLANLENFYGE
jgi:superfamily I DNA/RNA helicase